MSPEAQREARDDESDRKDFTAGIRQESDFPDGQ
jgi:hypothetical protein